ncbi:cyclin-like protein [Scheffersomyces amazonensis]|uniref:cyclin-like protein n=1 Tax=Scheffersomyces amazonensis TaxID=1078765 RepID=UPI00315CC59A
MVSSIDLKALNIFLNTPVNHDMIHKIVVATLQVLPCKDSKTVTYSSDSNIEKPLPSLMTFLTRLVRYTNVYTGTLMATLVYLHRLKSKLPKNAQGLPCTRHRILLSCLILSSKFHNDSSPKNKHWAKYTDGLFNANDINLMERQLLFLLNWDLKVSTEEMCIALNSFLEPIKQDLIKSSKMRKFLNNQRKQVEEKLAMAEAAAAAVVASSSGSSSNSSPDTSYSTSPLSSTMSTPASSRSNSISPGSNNLLPAADVTKINYNNNNYKHSNNYNNANAIPNANVSPSYSRSSSTSSMSGASHYRQQSTSSVSSMSSTSSSIMDSASMYSSGSSTYASPIKRSSTSSGAGVDPVIELAALKEEHELNKLLRKLNANTNQSFQQTQQVNFSY